MRETICLGEEASLRIGALIVAMSEHHALQTFQQAFVPFVWLYFREGGTRVNAFASGGIIPASARGTHYDGLLALVDWFPTVCHLAGIKTIKSNLTEGNNTGPYFGYLLSHCPNAVTLLVHRSTSARWR